MKWPHTQVIEKHNDLVILGVPWDGSTSNRPGARLGPAAIRKVSHWFDADIDPQFPFDVHLTDLHAIDYGDVEIGKDYYETMQNIEDAASLIFSYNQNLVTMGGDHSITLPLLRAAHKKYGPISLIHFDAHADTWPIESPTTAHGSFFRSAVEEKLIDEQTSIQIGIRTCAPAASRIVRVEHCPIEMSAEKMAMFIRGNMPRRVVPVYITFDIDCLDPAFAPGTGTPVAGGLSSSYVLGIFKNLIHMNLIGLDVVEVSPPYDYSELTSVAASTIINYYLQLITVRKNYEHERLIQALS
jgi:agmatinase